ncbi:hypothetical protein [Nocardiopsis sp. MG754419]|uniref:hypothetical protein n=1 Tax=Nocardiopsis sp. MG754419 TaxID=2259865 RepID=UPI001BA9B6D7|nr:hypothetical protein [Nocardiopsis sp. MG754419]MBR8744299.1 hypothetical protein [Nocardiopsis sp. MG754419]
MSHSHSDRRNREGLGTKLLAGACCAGAVGYAVFVGPSMLPPPDVETTNSSAPEVLSSVMEQSTEQPAENAPSGSLRIQVTDRHHAWVQNLECTGDAEEDPAPCAAMAEVAADMAGDPTLAEATPDPEDTETDAADVDLLFAEIRDGTVCTDKVYGPQEAAIEGTWEGHEVDTSLSRRGSCEEARWQRLAPVTERFESE